MFAAGDADNDLQMLHWAKRQGDAVAMGQAEPHVQQAAGRVTGTVFENGLLTALRERFPEVLGNEGFSRL